MRCDALFRPQSIAIIGASAKPGRGQNVIASLDAMGFPGAIYPIHPKNTEILGHRCYPSLADVPGPVDLAVFAVGNNVILDVYKQAAAKGVRAATLYGVGFGESHDPAAQKLNKEIVGISHEAGIAMCGPNCMGTLSPATRSGSYAQRVANPEALRGNIGLISHSGSVGGSLAMDCRRFGYSHIVSAGNEAVLNAADYLDFMNEDPDTKVIALFIETIRAPERFIAGLDRAAELGKPVVVLRTGKSEQSRHAITSHTGGLAGESKAFSAALKRHRAIEVDEVDEMYEVLSACQGTKRARGRRIAVVCGSGGHTELMLDVAGAAGFNFPPLGDKDRAEIESVTGKLPKAANPLDAWGSGDFRETYPKTLSVLGRSPDFDAVVLLGDGMDDSPVSNPGNHNEFAKIVAEHAKDSDKPFYFLTPRSCIFRQEQVRLLREAGATLVGGMRQGLLAVDRLARWATPEGVARTPKPVTPKLAALGTTRASINEHDATTLLAQAGVPVVPAKLVQSPAEAEAAATAMGFPVVLKVVSDDIPHKSDLGLVKLGLKDAAGLRAAWDDMAQRLKTVPNNPKIAGFLVQRMVTEGVEVFIGVNRDRDYGLMIVFGVGGVLIDLLQEAVLRPLPLRQGDAEAMLEESPLIAKLLAGVRGAPACDTAALAQCLYAVSDFAWAEREALAELDINPIKVLPKGQGCVAVDALIVPRKADG